MVSCEPAVKEAPITIGQLEAMYEMANQKSFVSLQKAMNKYSGRMHLIDSLSLQATLHAARNQIAQSNECIHRAMAEEEGYLSKQKKYRLLARKATNHVIAHEYNEAALACQFISLAYDSLLTPEKSQDNHNNIKLWDALRDVPPLQTEVKESFQIPMLPDQVGLRRVQVNHPNYQGGFVFDTGANLSLISESVAQKMGLSLISPGFYVKAFTGKKVPSRLAVADSIRLGKALYHHVVFLVMADSSLSFPQIDYHINGIIGFPEIKALERITVTDSSLTVDKGPPDCPFNNLYFDGLSPYVTAISQEDTLMFSFDTGATNTDLFFHFYEKYAHRFDGYHQRVALSNSSAGGTTKEMGYQGISLTLQIGTAKAQIDSLDMFATPQAIHGDDLLYGNLGQDFIGKFSQMTIDFRCPMLNFAP